MAGQPSLLDQDLDLETLVQPLVAQVEALTAEINSLEARAAELRGKRTRYRGVLRSLAPEQVEPLGKTNGNGRKPRAVKGEGKFKAVSEERLTTIREWLTVNKSMVNAMNEGEGFYASEVIKEPSFPIKTSGFQSQMSNALVQLQERGVVHLNSVGNVGGRKYYKVV
jgi:hypothetical protein